MTEMHPLGQCRAMMRVGLGVSLLIAPLLAASCDFQSAMLRGTEGQASGDSEPVAEAISLPAPEVDDDAIAPEVSPNPDQSLAVPVIPDGLSVDPLGPTVGDTYARQPVQLVDAATPATDFYAFRAALQQAIANRDSEFLEAIAAPDIQLSFGTRTISDLNLDDPAALAWEKLERAIAPGCTQETFDPLSEVLTWVCPHVFLSPVRLSIAAPSSEVYVLENGVSVRTAPSAEGLAVDALSSEIVLADLETIRSLTPQQREQMETFAGWWPIITPSGQRGYVSSRYAYSPLGYRVFFEQRNGEWQMTLFASGD